MSGPHPGASLPSVPAPPADGGRTVVVAMSGGVDSSIAAALLAEAGWDVVGVTLKLWCYGSGDDAATPRSCCSLDAIADARSVALHMGFPHHVVDETEAFRAHVVAPFVRDYLAGTTPYPCAQCNTHLKFGTLFARARSAGADFLATGHYARLLDYPLPDGGVERGIARAADPDKDQTYALWGIDRAVLPRLVFPLGGMTKAEVRAHGERLGLSKMAAKPESQDLCFAPDGDYAGFVAREAAAAGAMGGAPDGAAGTPNREGPILDPEGREIGRHRGLEHYTVGQRRGLALAATAPEAAPSFVLSLDPGRNAVRVGPEEALRNAEARLADRNWLSAAAPVDGEPVEAQIRYRHRPAPARLHGDRLVFAAPQRAITPGQSAVFYRGDRLLGGARLARQFAPNREPGLAELPLIR